MFPQSGLFISSRARGQSENRTKKKIQFLSLYNSWPWRNTCPLRRWICCGVKRRGLCLAFSEKAAWIHREVWVSNWDPSRSPGRREGAWKLFVQKCVRDTSALARLEVDVSGSPSCQVAVTIFSLFCVCLSREHGVAGGHRNPSLRWRDRSGDYFDLVMAAGSWNGLVSHFGLHWTQSKVKLLLTEYLPDLHHLNLLHSGFCFISFCVPIIYFEDGFDYLNVLRLGFMQLLGLWAWHQSIFIVRFQCWSRMREGLSLHPHCPNNNPWSICVILNLNMR